MLNIDATFLLVFLSFVVFMLAMKQLYFDPIRQIKETREDKIRGDQQNALSLADQYQQLNQGYEAQLREARQKAQQIILEFRENAKKSAADQVSEAREEAHTELEAQLADLAKWREKTYKSLSTDKDQLVEAIISKVYAERPAKPAKATKTAPTPVEQH